MSYISVGILFTDNSGVFLLEKFYKGKVTYTDLGGKIPFGSSPSLFLGYKFLEVVPFRDGYEFVLEDLKKHQGYTIPLSHGLHFLVPIPISFLQKYGINIRSLKYFSFSEMRNSSIPICTRIRKFLFRNWKIKQVDFTHIERLTHRMVESVLS